MWLNFLNNVFLAHDRTQTSVIFERCWLDRRRVEAAHFQFGVLEVASRYPSPNKIESRVLHGGLDETLLRVVSIYHGTFMGKYASQYNYYGVVIMEWV